jgi:hypothetical protein
MKLLSIQGKNDTNEKLINEWLVINSVNLLETGGTPYIKPNSCVKKMQRKKNK